MVVHATLYHFSKIHFNIFFLAASRSSWFSLSFWLSRQIPGHVTLLPHACYIPCQSELPCPHFINFISRVIFYQFWRLSWSTFLQPSAISCHLDLNILLSTLLNITYRKIKRKVCAFLNITPNFYVFTQQMRAQTTFPVTLSLLCPATALPASLYYIKKTPWPEPASELYRPSDRRLSAKLVPNFADRGCHVVSATVFYGRILGCLGRSRYFFFQLAS
jgi:hypothetical protein